MRNLFILGWCLLSLTVFSQTEDKYYPVEVALLDAQYDSAITIANRMLEKDSLDWKLHYYLGKSNQAKNRYFVALDNFKKANALDTANYAVELSLAKIYDFTGQKEKAIQIYYDQFLRDTNRIEPIENLADLFRRNGEYSPAVHYYQKAIAIDGSRFNYYKQLGYCLNQLNLSQPAIYYYQHALRLNPYDLNMYKRLANLQNGEMFFDEAIQTCLHGLEQYPDDVQLMKLLGYSYYLNKDMDTAVSVFHEIIALGDTSFFNLKYLGLAYFELQNFSKATQILLQSVQKVDDDPEVLFFLGSACGRSGAYEEGVKFLNRSLKVLKPPAKQVASIYEELARIYVDLEKYDLSLDYLKLAYRNHAKPILSFKMGQIYDRYTNDKKQAINYYDGYLTMTNHEDTVDRELVFPDTHEKGLKEYVKERIRTLEEELFFEDAGKEK
ncbi:MAG: tetratricopeptide repeat protein [Bacteroidales bacterium]|jgi:tetratricopeptide (TPR) repeat protein|nr:tetratricopeptide repeat protein [Bacteroidales bacterium]